MIKPIPIPAGLHPSLQWSLDPNWDGRIAGLEERYAAWEFLTSINEEEGFGAYGPDADFLEEAFENLDHFQEEDRTITVGKSRLKVRSLFPLELVHTFALREVVKSYPSALVEKMAEGSREEKPLTIFVSDIRDLGRAIYDSDLDWGEKSEMVGKIANSEKTIQTELARQSDYQWRRGFYIEGLNLLWFDAISLMAFPGAELLFELFAHEFGHAADDYAVEQGFWSDGQFFSSLCDNQREGHPICSFVPTNEQGERIAGEILAGALAFYFSAMADGG